MRLVITVFEGFTEQTLSKLKKSFRTIMSIKMENSFETVLLQKFSRMCTFSSFFIVQER